MENVKIFMGRCSPCTEPIQAVDVFKILMYLINESDNQAKDFPTIESRKGEGKLPPKNRRVGTTRGYPEGIQRPTGAA
ncbi:hypothetical protein [Persephonella sp.]